MTRHITVFYMLPTKARHCPPLSNYVCVLLSSILKLYLDGNFDTGLLAGGMVDMSESTSAEKFRDFVVLYPLTELFG